MAGGRGSNSQYHYSGGYGSSFLTDVSNVLEKERTRLNRIYEGMGNVVDNPTFQRLFLSNMTPGGLTDQEFAYALELNQLDAMSLLGGGQGGGNTGPTTAQEATNIAATMTDIARTLGLPPQDWSSFALQAAQNNWTADVIRDLVADQINLDTSKNAGLVRDVIDNAKEIAANNYVSISDDEAFEWAKRVARNEMDASSVKGEIQRRAIAKFSWLQPQIESGITVKEYFRPHRELIGSLLEKPAEQIDMMNDMKWWPIVGGGKPTDVAPRRDMSLTETAQYVRSLDDWKKTKNARVEVDDAVVGLGKTLGVM